MSRHRQEKLWDLTPGQRSRRFMLHMGRVLALEAGIIGVSVALSILAVWAMSRG